MKKIRKLFERINGMKLHYRMLLVYLLGGALPIILIAVYLMHGISSVLLAQAKQGEVTELEMIRTQAEDLFSTVGTVTKYFYFDQKLEEISRKEYVDYQEVVDDYKSYTGFQDYTRYHNRIIAWVNIYMENDTLTENSRFRVLTEERKQEEWYAAVKKHNGGGVWRYRPIPAVGQEALSMLRMLKTARGEEVGILAVYIRPERFETLLAERGCDTLVVLNGDTLVADMAENVSLEDVSDYLPGNRPGQLQDSIRINMADYLMTCETISLPESEDCLQIVSFRPYEDILGSVNRQNAGSILIFAVSITVSVSIILLFSRSFSRRVELFHAQMHRAAEGNFELEEIGGNDEIASLYSYLGTMIGEIQRLLAQVYQEKLHADRLTIQQKDAQFKMLASQINPHFLYNTLETIRMKARRSGQGDIEEIVKMLAKIMRSYIQISETDTTLKKEIELVECYLKIQQQRFGERIRYRIDVEPGLMEYKILPLVIQPIVENSIIHGLESKEGEGNVRIGVSKKGGEVVISIEDDGLGIPAPELAEMRQRLDRYNENGRHIGVANVHQRVKLKYGEEYGVSIDSREHCFTRVEIHLPPMEGMRLEEAGKRELQNMPGNRELPGKAGTCDVQGDDN